MIFLCYTRSLSADLYSFPGPLSLSPCSEHWQGGRNEIFSVCFLTHISVQGPVFLLNQSRMFSLKSPWQICGFGGSGQYCFLMMIMMRTTMMMMVTATMVTSDLMQKNKFAYKFGCRNAKSTDEITREQIIYSKWCVTGVLGGSVG